MEYYFAAINIGDTTLVTILVNFGFDKVMIDLILILTCIFVHVCVCVCLCACV